MADEKLRELERRWRESGAWPDRLALLHARRRASELSPEELSLLAAVDDGLAFERVALLAYLALPVARQLLGDEVVALASYLGDLGAVRVALGDPTEPQDVLAWAGGLAHWRGPELELALAVLTREAARVLREVDVPPEPGEYYPYWRSQDRATATAEVIGYLDAWLARGNGTVSFSYRGFHRDDRSVALLRCGDALGEDLSSDTLPGPAWTCRQWAMNCEHALAAPIGPLLARAAPLLLEVLGRA